MVLPTATIGQARIRRQTQVCTPHQFGSPAPQPLNGKLDNVALSGGRAVERSLAVDERDFERLSYTRTELVGLAKMTFVFGFEIPADIVDRMFREPMTIRLNLSGAVRLVADDARNPRPTRLRYHMRLLGN